MNLLHQINHDFGKVLEATNPGQQMESLASQMADKQMFMDGKLFPTFIKPYFVEKSARPLFEKVTRLLISSLNKIGDTYFHENRFTDQIRLKGRLADLASLDPGYPGHQIINRLDIFYIPETQELKLLEYNCGDPSGMGWHDQMLEMFLGLPVIKKLQDKYEFQVDWLVKSHFKTFFKKYNEWCEKKGVKPEAKPNVSFVCKRDSTVLGDFLAFVEYYREMGYDTQFGDPRDFEYDGSKLLLNGKPIHLIYRDAIDDVILDPYWDDSQNLVQALRDNAVCFVNPVSAASGDWKSILEILSDPQYEDLFDEEERACHSAHIPWTRTLADVKTVFKGDEIDLLPFVRNNKSLFVLKPNDGYGGFGILVGPDASEDQWQRLIDKSFKEGIVYTVQELVNIPKEQFPEIENGKFLGFEPKNVNVNLWSHDGRFAGAFVRAAAGNIINVHQGGGMVPVFFVDFK
ncbi:hypothetical protein JW979_03855 [bacterium]|nr:hypothetical protein [candidate division CSSED10-310 bacterium]